MAKRATRLKGLRVHEISGVDRPANPGAMALLWKRDAGAVGKGPGSDAFDAAMAGQEAQETIQAAWQAFYETMDALRQAVCAIVESADIAPADKAGAIREAMQRAVDQLPDAIAEEAAEEGGGTAKRDRASDGVVKGAASRAAPSISGAARDGSGKGDHMPAENTVDHAARVAELEAALEKANKEKTAAEAKAAEVQKAEGDRIAKIEADLKKAAERAEAAETLAKAEREAREMLALEKRAAEEFPFAGKPSDIAKTLRRIEKIEDEAERKRELDLLKAHNANVQLLTKERGTAAPGSTAGSALAELEERAGALVKADPKLSLREARDRVMDSDVALQKRWKEERANGH